MQRIAAWASEGFAQRQTQSGTVAPRRGRRRRARRPPAVVSRCRPVERALLRAVPCDATPARPSAILASRRQPGLDAAGPRGASQRAARLGGPWQPAPSLARRAQQPCMACPPQGELSGCQRVGACLPLCALMRPGVPHAGPAPVAAGTATGGGGGRGYDATTTTAPLGRPTAWAPGSRPGRVQERGEGEKRGGGGVEEGLFPVVRPSRGAAGRRGASRVASDRPATAPGNRKRPRGRIDAGRVSTRRGAAAARSRRGRGSRRRAEMGRRRARAASSRRGAGLAASYRGPARRHMSAGATGAARRI